jgi:2-oxoglutarate dehydrogenase E2 component (dihydrolipoamide succinyltransferase)
MATRVVMPQLGESVVEGTVTRWLKRAGETVQEYESLLEVNTDKVDTEIPAPASGTVLQLLVPEGETVRAGTLLALIGEPDEVAGETTEVLEETAWTGAPAASGSSVSDSGMGPREQPARRPIQPPASVARGRVKRGAVVPEGSSAPGVPGAGAAPTDRTGLGFISPVVARISRDRKVDLAQVKGTGQGGRITKQDVLAFIDSRAVEPPPWDQPALGELFRPTEELTGMGLPVAAPTEPTEHDQVPRLLPLDNVRRAIAEHMVRSKAVSPHVTTVMEADLRRVVAHRQVHQEAFARDGVHLTYTAYFVAASVAALRAVPQVNASWSDEGIVLHGRVNIGVAVSLGDQGLIAPVLKDADRMSLLGVARGIADLANRARLRQLKPDEVHEGTFTITNHGMGGSLFATPIIHQPQSAILGVGAIQKRVIVLPAADPQGGTTDSIAIRPMVYLTLTFDHRVLDGALADVFLGKLVQVLETWT